MSKVRVYELAKEYGIKGPDLAQMLAELGFEKIKSHMAVLDDATELHARAVIEAQGLAAAPAEAEAAPSTPRKKRLPGADDGPRPKKKLPTPSRKALPKKKPLPDLPLKTGTGATTTPEPAPAVTEPEPEPAAAAAPAEPAPAEAPPPPAAHEPVAPEPAAPEPAAPEPAAPEPAAPEPAAPEPTRGEPAPVTAAERVPRPEPIAPAEPAETASDQIATPQAPAAETPPARSPATEAAAAEAPPAAAAASATPAKAVKRLIVPEQKAKVVGRIELPQEAIRDAKRRSAPSTGRNPGGVDRSLRQRALSNTQSRSASRPGGRPGLGGRGGPMGGGMRRGGRAGRPGGRAGSRRGTPGSGLTSTVDPNKVIEIEPPISIKGLSEAIGVKVNDLIKVLTFKLGVVGKNINSFLSEEEVELVALEVNRNIKIVQQTEAEDELIQDLTRVAEEADEIVRAPVVTFMGHVDHGKTTLLDALRLSTVVKGEAGGITQHIGAYRVRWQDGNEFVVLDTPGHEAFTAMRARGAKITDVVVLVVAADDGVMPQTEEAIAHAKAAETPIIVAINKCDRPNANPMQVKQQLSVKGLQAEDWGGTVQMVEVSALTGQGLDELVEAIHLQAELLELTAKPKAAAVGVVIESKQTPEAGVVVNVLVTNGTLRLRDQVLCGESLSRVRGVIDDRGEQIEEAGPSTPVQLLGLTSLPTPGDKLYAITDKKKAKEVVEDRQRSARTRELAERSERTRVTFESLSDQLKARAIEETKLILKADVMGSLQPIKDSLERLNTDEVRVNIVHSALGGITETDVSLAEASGATVIGFNTIADQSARMAADRAGVEIRYYDVIYKLIDEVKLLMEGMLKPEEVEEIRGHAEIKAVFRSSKFGNIAGLLVGDGVAQRNARVRLSRDGKVVYTGTVQSLRREKDDVREVKAGLECGMTLSDFNDIKAGDQLEFFDVKLVKRTLD